MAEYFPTVSQVRFEGPESRNPFAFKHYNPDEYVLGKTMADHLRFAVCYWHSFKNLGADPFGLPTMIRAYNDSSDPMTVADHTLDAAFEFFTKLGVRFWCFHDVDIAPEADTLAETEQRLDHIVGRAKQYQADTGIQLLWGTCNLFSNRRFLAGGGTNPSPDVYAFAAAKVKKALEITHELGGLGYVFWGGREGYETLLNTDMGRELDNLARFLHMAHDYKTKIGFQGQFYIEPKPKEPTKHQYDFDAASCYAFLRHHGLPDQHQLIIEANHATLAGHSFHHELIFAFTHGLFGSVDANRGDELLGWDTDQFATNVYDTTLAMYIILQGGGFRTGGLNFDAKLRRQSIDPEDLFHAHIGSMDSFARGLKIAAAMIEDGRLAEALRKRYAGWDSEFGKAIESGEHSLESLAAHAHQQGEPAVHSGRQEYLENLINDYL